MNKDEITKEQYLKALDIVEEYHEQIMRKISKANALSDSNRPMVYRGDMIEIIKRKDHLINKLLTVGSQHIVSSKEAWMSRGTKYRLSTLVFRCKGGLLVDSKYSYKIVKRNNE